MAITGNTTINVGLPNESTGSDSLYTAFNKINNNFAILFANASPNVIAGNGIGIAVANNTATITNTGVLDIIQGTGNVIVSNVGGVYTISIGNVAAGMGTVTSVNVVPISTSRITSTGGPITTSGAISIDLATTGVTAGTYTSPVITIDAYGRVTSATTGAGSGTVSSVGLTPGSGIGISGGPITSSGNITVTNTGVTRLSAGPGIALSGSNGNVTITSLLSLSSVGTVTSVDITSSSLTVAGGPISTSGTFNIELPSSITLTGNLVSNDITASSFVVNASTSTNLVTLTQRGSGNVLVVEDTASDSTPFVITGSGFVITGATTSQIFGSSLQPKMQIISDNPGQGIFAYETSSFPPYMLFAKSRGGSISAKTTVQNGDYIGRLYFQGYNTSNFVTGARIEASVDGVPSATDMPTKIEFLTTKAGTTTPGIRMTITNSGATTIETTDNTNAALRVTQTGSGDAFVVEDSTNPDATPFIIDNSGAVSIGYTSQITAGSKLEVVDADASIYNFSTGSSGANLNLMKSSNNTTGGQGLVSINDYVFRINGYASDGVQFAKAGDILIQVEEAPVAGSDSVPSKMIFATTGNGNTAPTTRQTIHSNGSVNFANILLLSGSEDLANGGAASLLETATYFTTGATGETGTLAAGSTGMVKTFMMRGDGGGDMVITVTNAGWKTSGTGTMTFDTVGDGCTLQYINSKWFCVGNNGVVFA